MKTHIIRRIILCVLLLTLATSVQGESPVRPNALKITFLSWGTGSTKLSCERALPERQQSAESCASIIGAGWDGYHNSPLGMTLRYGHKFFLGNYSPSRPLDGFFVRPEAIYCHYGYDSASDGSRQISQMGALLATAGYQKAFGRWLVDGWVGGGYAIGRAADTGYQHGFKAIALPGNAGYLALSFSIRVGLCF